MTTLVDFARDLRNRIDIVDVIGNYVQLTRAGSNWKGLCPFHREKTPSFMVSPTKNMFHCFGCHVGGDVIRFVELIEHVEWKEAVKLLAERCGIPMPKLSFRESVRSDVKKTLYEINDLSAKHFEANLCAALQQEGHPVREFIERRRLDSETIQKFRLGLALDEWGRLTEEIRRAGYDLTQAVGAGVLLKHPDSGRIYDRFRGRFVFPICDNVGRPIAFGARLYLPDAPDDQPKYINSPETELYHKGEHLYAFHLAKETIARKRYAILVEGYMDAIRLHQAGFTNTIASCGTALTSDQARHLRRLCDRVVFVYDGDDAGQKAMLRGSLVLLEHDFLISIVALPDDHDPDSFILAHGADKFREHLERASDFFEFFLERAKAMFGVDNVSAKTQVFRFLVPILRKVTNAIALETYLRRTAAELDTDVRALRRELAKASDKIEVRSTPPRQAAISTAPVIERYVLKLSVENEELRFVILEHIQPEWLTNELVRKWFEVCRDRTLDGLDVDWESLLSQCETEAGEQEAALLRSIALEESEPLEAVDELIIRNVAARLEQAYLRKEWGKIVETCAQLFPNEPQGEASPEVAKRIKTELSRYARVAREVRPDPLVWRNTGFC